MILFCFFPPPTVSPVLMGTELDEDDVSVLLANLQIILAFLNLKIEVGSFSIKLQGSDVCLKS